MEYNRIRYFLRAAECRNFTRAAEELYVSRQALTKQIALLEEDLGIRLFDRDTRNVNLTPVGREAYERLKVVTEELDNTIADLKSYASEEIKKISVGFFVGLPYQITVHIMEYLQQEMEEYRIEPLMLEMPQLREALQNEEIDVCVTHVVGNEHWANSRYILLATSPGRILVSNKHPWAKKQEVTQEDMRQEEFLMLGDNGANLDNFFATVPCRRAVSLPNLNSVLTRLRLGKSFAITTIYDSADEDYVDFAIPYGKLVISMEAICRGDDEREKVIDVMGALEKIQSHF